MLTSILGHVPAGAGVKQLLHYAQNINHSKNYLRNINKFIGKSVGLEETEYVE